MPRASLMLAALLAVVALAILVGGCGSTDSTSTVSRVEKEEKKAEAEAPKGASPQLRAIYLQFPPPKPNPGIGNSAKAIAAGEAACAGKTPLEVSEEFLSKSELSNEQREAVKMIGHYEKHPSYSFPAGQIAAGVYENTLPEPGVAVYGYQGCVYALAQGLEARLAPK